MKEADLRNQACWSGKELGDAHALRDCVGALCNALVSANGHTLVMLLFSRIGGVVMCLTRLPITGAPLAVLVAQRLHVMRLIVYQAALLACHIPSTKHLTEVCQTKVNHLRQTNTVGVMNKLLQLVLTKCNIGRHRKRDKNSCQR